MIRSGQHRLTLKVTLNFVTPLGAKREFKRRQQDNKKSVPDRDFNHIAIEPCLLLCINQETRAQVFGPIECLGQ